MKLIYFAMLVSLTACSFSINQIHTQGIASDVVDEDQKADATVSPDISLPLNHM